MSSVRLSCIGKKKNRAQMLLWDGWYVLYWQSQLEVISSMIRTMISLLWQIDSILKNILFQTAGCVKVEVVVSHFSLCSDDLGKSFSIFSLQSQDCKICNKPLKDGCFHGILFITGNFSQQLNSWIPMTDVISKQQTPSDSKQRFIFQPLSILDIFHFWKSL